jgi:hypothetical protein
MLALQVSLALLKIDENSDRQRKTRGQGTKGHTRALQLGEKIVTSARIKETLHSAILNLATEDHVTQQLS